MVEKRRVIRVVETVFDPSLVGGGGRSSIEKVSSEGGDANGESSEGERTILFVHGCN